MIAHTPDRVAPTADTQADHKDPTAPTDIVELMTRPANTTISIPAARSVEEHSA